MMEGLAFMEAEHVFFFIFPRRNFLRVETEAEVILNPCGWVHGVSADLVRMKALPMGQAFLAETSPSCVSFLFSACCMV